MTDDRIDTLADWIIDCAEEGWSLRDILDAMQGDGVTLAEAKAALAEAYHDEAVQMLAAELAADHDRRRGNGSG